MLLQTCKNKRHHTCRGQQANLQEQQAAHLQTRNGQQTCKSKRYHITAAVLVYFAQGRGAEIIQQEFAKDAPIEIALLLCLSIYLSNDGCLILVFELLELPSV